MSLTTQPENWRKRPRFWTAERLFVLSGYLDQGWDDARIARAMSVSKNAVVLARKRHGLQARHLRHLTARRDVAELLGVPCSKTITRWIARGWLKGKRGGPRGKNRDWMIDWDDLFDFLRDPDHWHRWDVSRIGPDSPLWWACADARAHHATERYLTLSEVADRYYVTISTVSQWITKGWLPSVRNGNRLIPESALVGFVRPLDRERPNHRPNAYTPAEDALVLAHPLGASWDAIRLRRRHQRAERAA